MSRIHRSASSLVIAAIAFLLVTLPASAKATQVLVTGTFTTVDADLRDTFTLGPSYSLTYEWNGPGLETPAGPNGSIYREAGLNFRLESGSYVITSSNAGYALFNFPAVDSFHFGAAERWTTTTPGTTLQGSGLIAGRFPYYAVIELQDGTAQALSDTVLATPLPDMSRYSSQVFVLRFATSTTPGAAFGVLSARGTIDSISVVPVPSAFPLLAIAMVSLLRFQKKNSAPRSQGIPTAT